MTKTETPKVETYNLTAANGRRIRTATQVVYADGRTVRFMERLTKTEAIRQAARLDLVAEAITEADAKVERIIRKARKS